MRILIGALSVAMLAGCVSPAMNDARSKAPSPDTGLGQTDSAGG